MNREPLRRARPTGAWFTQGPTWTLRLEATDDLHGATKYQADLLRDGERMCRIALSGHFADADEAKAALYLRLCACLDDIHARSTGDGGASALL